MYINYSKQRVAFLWYKHHMTTLAQPATRLSPQIYGDGLMSRAKSRINNNEIFLQHDWLFYYLSWLILNMIQNKGLFLKKKSFLLKSISLLGTNKLVYILSLFYFSRYNRFAETHSNLQLSYHITDCLLAAGNNCLEHCWSCLLSSNKNSNLLRLLLINGEKRDQLAKII